MVQWRTVASFLWRSVAILGLPSLALGTTVPGDPLETQQIRARIDQAPTYRRATERGLRIYTFEPLRENTYLLETRSLDSSGWPQLVRSQTLSLRSEVDRQRIRRILSASDAESVEKSLPKAPPPTVSLSPIWSGTVPWSKTWEQEYSRWIRHDVTETFFLQHDIPTDCADMVYALRWIFSRMHNLPAAFELVGTQRVLSNLTSQARWDTLPTHSEWHKDQKFRASLSYLFDTTNTISLREAGYPVAVTTSALRAGVYRVTNNSSGSRHAMVFHRINPAPSTEYPMINIQSDVPQAVRRLRVDYLKDRDPLKKPEEVFRRFRTVLQNGRTTLIQASEWHSDFSLEQLDEKRFPRDRWAHAILRFVNPQFSPEWIGVVAAKTMKEAILSRVQNVENGFAFCLRNPCVPGTRNFENWSTPARDERAIEFYRNYEQFVSTDDLNDEVTILGVPVPIGFIYRFWSQKSVGSWDPRDSIERRWGFFPELLAEDARRLLEEAGHARVLALSSGLNSAERFKAEHSISIWTLHWPDLYFRYAKTHSGVRQLLNDLIRRFSETRVPIAGVDRSLRQWFAFFSAISNVELFDDPWGARMSSDYVSGLVGESVLAVNSSKALTLTEHLLIDERSLRFVPIASGPGTIRDYSAHAQMVSTGQEVFDWETGTLLPCPSAQFLSESPLVLCQKSIWKKVPGGFSIVKKDLKKTYVIGSASSGERPGAVLIGLNESFYLSNTGTLTRIPTQSNIRRILQSRGHLVIEGTAGWLAINLASGTSRSISGAEDLWSDPATEMVFFTKSHQLWKLNLSRSQNKAQLISPETIESTDFIPSQLGTFQRNLGMVFRLQNSLFAFFWNHHAGSSESDPIEIFLAQSQTPHTIVPTPAGYDFCSADGRKYALKTFSSSPMTVPSIAGEVCTLPLRDMFVEQTASQVTIRDAFGHRVPSWIPVLDVVEKWESDYIPAYRSAMLSRGPVWLKRTKR